MTSISLLDRYIRFQILKCLNYLLQLAEFKVNRPLSAAPFTPKITNKYKMTINTDIYPLFSYLFSLFFIFAVWFDMLNVHVVSIRRRSTGHTTPASEGLGSRLGSLYFQEGQEKRNHKQNDKTKYKQARLGNKVENNCFNVVFSSQVIQVMQQRNVMYINKNLPK